MKQVITGLCNHFCDIALKELLDMNIDSREVRGYVNSLIKAFDYFIKCLDVDIVEQPLSLDTLRNPDSDEVCMLLFLYSIEPPFYGDLN